MAEVVQKTVDEIEPQGHLRPRRARRHAAEDRHDRGRGRGDAVLGQSDLAFTMSYEVLPTIELGDFKGLKLEREVADVDAEEIEKAAADRPRAPRTMRRGERGAADGDRVSFDFVGKIDGEAVRGRQGRERADRARLGPVHPRASRSSWSAPRPARNDDRRQVPGGLSGDAPRRQGGDSTSRSRRLPSRASPARRRVRQDAWRSSRSTSCAS